MIHFSCSPKCIFPPTCNMEPHMDLQIHSMWCKMNTYVCCEMNGKHTYIYIYIYSYIDIYTVYIYVYVGSSWKKRSCFAGYQLPSIIGNNFAPSWSREWWEPLVTRSKNYETRSFKSWLFKVSRILQNRKELARHGRMASLFLDGFLRLTVNCNSLW